MSAATRTPNVEQHPDAVPIYQAVTFSATSAAELADVLGDRQQGYSYSRIDNPTSQALADAIAEVEGAEAAFVFGTGMAALHAAFATVLRAGDHMIVSRQIYGSVQHLIQSVFGRFGVESTFVDITDTDAVEAAFMPSTRLLHFETLANPTLTVADIADLIERGHRHGALVSVDNTFASPYLCRPAELGADLTMEALTKWIGGHSDVLGGSVAGSKELIKQVRCDPDRHRWRAGAVQRVPRPARPRDAPCAHGPSRANGHARWRAHSRRVTSRPGSGTRAWPAIRSTPSRSAS